MKAKQINEKTSLFFKFFWILTLTVATVSCDVLESDPDILEPNTEITGDEIFVLANSASIIDLNTTLRTNVPVRIELTTEARRGTLTDLGNGILQYSPSVGNSSARDGFEFTVYTLNNEIIKRDSIVIVIENDSTNLPCNIYPMPDYVYGVHRDPVIIDVISNDIICGGDVIVSVFKPQNSFPPYFGKAEMQGNKVKYSPGPSFQGIDKIIYKITSLANTAKTAYGLVYITGDSVCAFTLTNDQYVFNQSAVDSAIVLLPVFQNDSLCHSLNQYQINLKSAPLYGQAAPVANGFNYTVPTTVTYPFADHFTYEVCIDAICKVARVDVRLKKDSLSTCTIRARPDSINIVYIDPLVVYVDVLRNDSICGDLKDLRITKQPLYGISTVSNDLISYQPNAAQLKDDTLRYEICNGRACSSAAVFIKRRE